MGQGRISIRQKRLRIEKVRLLMAQGHTDQFIMDELTVVKRTLNNYKKLVRIQTLKEYDGKQVVDLWIDHKKRMENVINQAYDKLALGKDSDVTPEKLYKVIESASESIINMGVKIGIIPQITQRFHLEAQVKQDDDKLRNILEEHRLEIERTGLPAEPNNP